MSWPTVTDYNEAIQNLRATVADEELRNGTVTRKGRLPAKWPGNFATVYQVKCAETGNTWAVKCFTRKTAYRQERYRAISDRLQQTRLRSAVKFRYLDQGIQIHGEWFPVVKMKWVEGKPLNEFIEEHLENKDMLRQFLQLWPLLAGELQTADIAHADLQHGNVLLLPREDGRYSLKLVDYDGMYLPALAGTPPGEFGHVNYQHPCRSEKKVYSGDVDRFSHLVIYSAVRSLASGHLDLWPQHNDGENLLFRQSDFQAPRQSQVFHALWQSADQNVRALVGRLILACVQPLETATRLDAILDDGDVRPLDKGQTREIEAVLGVAKAEAAPARPAPPVSRENAETSVLPRISIPPSEIEMAVPAGKADVAPPPLPGRSGSKLVVSAAELRLASPEDALALPHGALRIPSFADYVNGFKQGTLAPVARPDYLPIAIILAILAGVTFFFEWSHFEHYPASPFVGRFLQWAAGISSVVLYGAIALRLVFRIVVPRGEWKRDDWGRLATVRLLPCLALLAVASYCSWADGAVWIGLVQQTTTIILASGVAWIFFRSGTDGFREVRDG